MMPSSRIPSPARSQGEKRTPRRYKPRASRSVGSPARSDTSVKLSAVIRMDSFVLSPMPTRRSVLTDNTDIDIPRRKSWWKKLDENSREIMEVLNNKDQPIEANNAIEEYIEVDVLSQEKKNYTLELPDSSDGESISSIVIPQRKLFTQKESQPQNKFGQIIDNRESLAKLHKSHAIDERELNVGPKNLFNKGTKQRNKPIFPSALLNISTSKTLANKTKELVSNEAKGQVKTLFGNRPGTKRKNMFADFIASESEDDISEIQPKIFGFQNKMEQKRRQSLNSRGGREHSPTSSVTDIEMDDWRLLPSSTMVDHQLEDGLRTTPSKKARLSKLSEGIESVDTTANKTKHSNKTMNSRSRSKNASKFKDIEGNILISPPSDEELGTANNNQTNKKNISDTESVFKTKSKILEHNKSKNGSQMKTVDEGEELITNENNKLAEQSGNHKSRQNKTSKTSSKIDQALQSSDDEDFTLEYENDDDAMEDNRENRTIIDITVQNLQSSKGIELKKSSISERSVSKQLQNKSKSENTTQGNKTKDEGSEPKANDIEFNDGDKNIPSQENHSKSNIDNNVHIKNREVSYNKSRQNLSRTGNEENKKQQEAQANDQTVQIEKKILSNQNTSREITNEAGNQKRNNEEIIGIIESLQMQTDHGNKSQKDIIINDIETQRPKVVDKLDRPENNQATEDVNEDINIVQNNSKVYHTNNNENVPHTNNNDGQKTNTKFNNEENMETEVQNYEEPVENNQNYEENTNIVDKEKLTADNNDEKQSDNNDKNGGNDIEVDVDNQDKSQAGNNSEEDDQNDMEEDAIIDHDESKEEVNESETEELQESSQNDSQEVESDTEEVQEDRDVSEAEGERDVTEDSDHNITEDIEVEEEENENEVAQEESREEDMEQNESQDEVDNEIVDNDNGDDNEDINSDNENECEEHQSENESERNESEDENEYEQDENVNNESGSDNETDASGAENECAENEGGTDNKRNESDDDNECVLDEGGNDNESNESEDENELVDNNITTDVNECENESENDIDQYDQEANERDAEENVETNVTHDTTGRHRKKRDSKVPSPEVIRHDKTNQMESFTAQGRNTSVRKTKSMIKNIHRSPSLAPVRESTGISDGARDSSAEGSGWDSHRTTRMTLRQTFGRDFTPRKSLRALVMEKSAKRQTNFTDINVDISKLPQANSTEFPRPESFDDDDDMDVQDAEEQSSDHEASRRTRQTTLEMYLQKVKKQNIERRKQLEEEIKSSLKAPTRDMTNPFKVPAIPKRMVRRTKPQKPQAKAVKSIIPLNMLPAEVLEDMNYKPPKRYKPANASWITNRLYKFLETKLEPKYDYRARVRSEKLVETIYSFTKDVRRVAAAPPHAVDALKREMARLHVVTTHVEFYEFFHEYMPREVRIKVVPDVFNKIPLPKHGVFSDILR